MDAFGAQLKAIEVATIHALLHLCEGKCTCDPLHGIGEKSWFADKEYGGIVLESSLGGHFTLNNDVWTLICAVKVSFPDFHPEVAD